jgi:cell division protein FtsZ
MNITATSDMEFEEVAEASEYIHKEVGEDAEIFWGTSVDDTLGEEMRVTVIATGIGKDEDEEEKPARTLRGRIRDIEPEDLERIVDYDEPTFIRQKKAVGESSGAIYRGTDGAIITESELDIPTFLRRKAD